MADKFKDQFSQNSNSPSKSGKDSFKTNKKSTFDMFDINVKKAQKDIDEIFGTAKKSSKDYQKSFTKSINKIFDHAINRTKEFERTQINSAKRVSSSIISEYNKVGRSLRESQIGIGDTIFKEISSGFAKATEQFSEMNVTANVKKGSGSKQEPDNSDKELKDAVKSTGQSIDKTINKGISIFVNRFESGIEKLSDKYESSFSKIAVLNSTTAKEYRQYQSETASTLKEMDLNNNIRTSDIMQKLEDVSIKGLVGEDARNKALADTISNAISPFLDTTTDAYTDLQLKLGTNFVNEMNGMVKAVSDTAGSSRFISRNINDILSQLEPIATNARNEQFSQQFGEMAATIDSLVQSGNMTMSQANELKETVMLSMDPYKALQSNNLAAKTAAATATEEQFQNPQEMLKLVGNTLTYFGDVSQGQDPRARGAMASAIGVDTMGFTWNAVTSSEFTKALDNSKGLSNLSDTGKMLQRNLAEDQYTTAKTQKDIRAENDVTGVARFKERFPDAYALVDSISGTLGSIENLLKIQTATDTVSAVSDLVDGKDLIKGVSDNSKYFSKISEVLYSIKDFKKSDIINLGKLGSTGNKMVSGSGTLGKLADIGFESGAEKSSSALIKGITSVVKDGISKLPGPLNKVATAGVTKMTSIASSFGGTATKLLSNAGSIATKGIQVLSKAAGPLMIAAGGIMAVKDALGATKKSKEWLGSDSLGAKTSSGIGGFIGGSGPGIGQGADPDEVKKNVKRNTGKWALVGAGIGTIVGGPIGTAIGGAIGAGVGAITGAIGGQRIAKVAKGIGDILHKGIDGAIKANPITNIMQRQFNHIKENSSEAFSEMKDIWGDKDKSFISKVTGTFGVISKTLKDNRKDWAKSFTEFKDDAVEKLTKIGDTFKKIGHAFTKEGATENLNKIKEKFTGTVKDARDSYYESQDNIEKVNQSKEEQIKGSHASGLDSVPYDGYLAKLHKGESVFNKQASNMIKESIGITAKSVGALSSLSPINRMSSFIKGGIEGMSGSSLGDNSDVVKAIEVATSKLIEAINSNTNASEPKITDNKDGLLPSVTSVLLGGVTGKAISSMVNLKGSMPLAKDS